MKYTTHAHLSDELILNHDDLLSLLAGNILQSGGLKIRYTKDNSKGGPCPTDCPICADEKPPEHDLTASQHTGELPDGIMDLCPKCVDDDKSGWHYKGDWHRAMLKELKL